MTVAHKDQFFVHKHKQRNFKANKTISQYHLVVGGGGANFVGMSHVKGPSGALPRRGVSGEGARERATLGTPLSSKLIVHLTLGIQTRRDSNALPEKLTPCSEDDHDNGTLGCVWAHDVVSVRSRTNIPRRIVLPRWLILKRSPESVGWNEKYSHLHEIQPCDYRLRISWTIFYLLRSVPGIFQISTLYNV